MANGITWLLYPNNSQHAPITDNQLVDMIGIIPSFFSSNDVSAPLDQAAKGYGFPLGNLGGTVNAEGEYQYPDDPTLKPIAACFLAGGDSAGTYVFIYDYGIVAFVPLGGDQFVCRMD